MKYTYLDNASTTFLDDEVKRSMLPWLSCANPNSHHVMGKAAAEAVTNARLKIATYLGVEVDTIFFTSGASESNTWALSGFKNKNYSYTLTSKIEHHSILNNPDAGIPIDVTREGKIDFDNFKWWPRVDFCSFMMVNNITGVANNLKEVRDRLLNTAILHADCTQALGKKKLNIVENGLDLISCSSHKIYGPKGIGLLYINHRTQNKMRPLIYGGGQEFYRRGGTTPVAQIVGFAKAVELAYENFEQNNAWLHRIHDYFVERLVASNLDYEFIVNPDKQLPSHLNVAFLGIRGEQLMSQLSRQGICVSTGSACDSDDTERNYVLSAMKVPDELIDSSIRFSFSKDNTLEEIDYTINVLETILPLMK